MMIHILGMGRIIIHIHIFKTKLENEGHLLELGTLQRLSEEGPRWLGRFLRPLVGSHHTGVALPAHTSTSSFKSMWEMGLVSNVCPIAWCSSCPNWNTVDPEVRESLTRRHEDGEFW